MLIKKWFYLSFVLRGLRKYQRRWLERDGDPGRAVLGRFVTRLGLVEACGGWKVQKESGLACTKGNP